MGIVNLKDHYPQQYPQDCFIEVSDEIEAAMMKPKRADGAHHRRKYRNRAQYSLDRGDGIEQNALDLPRTPWAILEGEMVKQELFTALNQLPDNQRRRVYAFYILGKSKAQIARDEGVHKCRITRSIKKGLDKMYDFVRCPF